LGLTFCVILSIQCGLHPVLVHSYTDATVIKTSIIIVTEFAKILMSFAVLIAF